MQVRRYQTSKLNINEVMKHFQFELKNRFSCLSLEVEQHGKMSEDEDEVAPDNEVEKKKTKTRQTY